MSSTNYSIEIDSTNFGGGLSESANYSQESTLGEIATGFVESTNYKIRAGYQQIDGGTISVSSSGDVILSPSIDGTTGGTANGTGNITVITDNPAGYALYIKASSSPALSSSYDSFADYTPLGANPDFTFSVAAGDSEFGFSPEGSDIVQKYQDNTTSCNAGSSDTVNSCWYGLSTSNEQIAGSSSANNPGGTVTTLKFRALVGSSHPQIAGSYTATTTVTAVPL